MPQQLFSSFVESWPFCDDNTIQINDSPQKSMCNNSGNAIYLDPWSRHQPNNNYSLDNLVSWLNFINLYYMPCQFKKYVDGNQKDCPLLVADDSLLLHMMPRIALFAKNVKVYYNVIKVPHLNYS